MSGFVRIATGVVVVTLVPIPARADDVSLWRARLRGQGVASIKPAIVNLLPTSNTIDMVFDT